MTLHIFFISFFGHESMNFETFFFLFVKTEFLTQKQKDSERNDIAIPRMIHMFYT